MRYQEFLIRSELAPYVQLVWSLESDGVEEAPPEHILPDGIVEMVFHYGDPWVTSVAGGPGVVQPQSFAISMLRKYVEIVPQGRTGFIAVRCFPWGACHFFSKPIRAFLDDTIDAELLWPDSHAEWMSGFVRTGGELERVAMVQDYLVGKLALYRKEEDAMEEGIRHILASGGQMTMGAVCAAVGLTKKQLERKFLARVGATPKVFARVVRFLNICRHIRQYEGVSLSQLALECGYFDQAHFIREFRAFSGDHPKGFFERHRVGVVD
jgi:AraC-like DNA-binding protein